MTMTIGIKYIVCWLFVDSSLFFVCVKFVVFETLIILLINHKANRVWTQAFSVVTQRIIVVMIVKMQHNVLILVRTVNVLRHMRALIRFFVVQLENRRRSRSYETRQKIILREISNVILIIHCKRMYLLLFIIHIVTIENSAAKRRRNEQWTRDSCICRSFSRQTLRLFLQTRQVKNWFPIHTCVCWCIDWN